MHTCSIRIWGSRLWGDRGTTRAADASPRGEVWAPGPRAVWPRCWAAGARQAPVHIL